MTCTILKVLDDALKILEKSSQNNFEDYTRETIKNLDEFIKSGLVSSGKIEAKLMNHYRESPSKIRDIYRKTENIERSADTIRSQLSSINRYLSSLFGIEGSALRNALDYNDKTVLNEINNIIAACRLGDVDLNERFPYLYKEFNIPYETENVYAVDDCEKELAFLKTLDRDNITSLMKDIDTEKLAFILQTFRQPLVTNVREEVEGKTNKVKKARLNYDKLNLYKKFRLISPVALEPRILRLVSPLEFDEGVSTDDIVNENPGVSDPEPEIDNRELKAQDLAIKTGLPVEFAQIIQDKIDSFEALSQEEQSKEIQTAELRLIENFRKQLKKLTVQNFGNNIKKCNSYALKRAVETLKR